jgi:hypothetical protein
VRPAPPTPCLSVPNQRPPSPSADAPRPACIPLLLLVMTRCGVSDGLRRAPPTSRRRPRPRSPALPPAPPTTTSPHIWAPTPRPSGRPAACVAAAAPAAMHPPRAPQPARWHALLPSPTTTARAAEPSRCMHACPDSRSGTRSTPRRPAPPARGAKRWEEAARGRQTKTTRAGDRLVGWEYI